MTFLRVTPTAKIWNTNTIRLDVHSALKTSKEEKITSENFKSKENQMRFEIRKQNFKIRENQITFD